MNYAKIIGNNLKEARKAKGYTQKEIAVKMRMTQQQYSRFENGIFELNYWQILSLFDLSQPFGQKSSRLRQCSVAPIPHTFTPIVSSVAGMTT